ncbi:MAG: hypothetical protein V4543_14815 [Bacteroidota bacterium]
MQENNTTELHHLRQVFENEVQTTYSNSKWTTEQLADIVNIKTDLVIMHMQERKLNKYPQSLAEACERKAVFIVALAENGGFSAKACRVANISRSTLYLWKNGDGKTMKPDLHFTEYMDEVLASSADNMESALYRAGINGDVKAMIFYLKARRREVYGEGLPPTVSELVGRLTR